MSDNNQPNKSKRNWFSFKNWSYKYKFQVMNESTLEEKFSFELSRMNVFIAFSLFSVFIVAFTIFVIALTPLKEYIPGYSSVKDERQVEQNAYAIDTIANSLRQRQLYMDNYGRIVMGGGEVEEIDSSMLQKSTDIDYNNLQDHKSDADSALRREWEDNAKYDLIYFPDEGASLNIHQYLFFTPFRGSVSSGFNAKKGHYGIDIVGEKDQAVKGTLEGTVLFADWTYEGGYTIAVQHNDDLISVYKHNSSLLKEVGDHIKPGDPIAIVGNTGHNTTGPHLHFEIWYRGNPMDPAEFIAFE